jgi:hypothetical protein
MNKVLQRNEAQQLIAALAANAGWDMLIALVRETGNAALAGRL